MTIAAAGRLAHDEVDQLAGHVDLLDDLLALQEALRVGLRAGPLQNVGFGGA